MASLRHIPGIIPGWLLQLAAEQGAAQYAPSGIDHIDRILIRLNFHLTDIRERARQRINKRDPYRIRCSLEQTATLEKLR